MYGDCALQINILGRQTQQETTNKAAGQDNVPFDKVRGLCRREENK